MPICSGDSGKRRRRSREKKEDRMKGLVWWRSRRRQKKTEEDTSIIIVVSWMEIKAFLHGVTVFFIKVSFWHWLLSFFFIFFCFSSNFSTTSVLKCDTLTWISGGAPGPKWLQIRGKFRHASHENAPKGSFWSKIAEKFEPSSKGRNRFQFRATSIFYKIYSFCLRETPCIP